MLRLAYCNSLGSLVASNFNLIDDQLFRRQSGRRIHHFDPFHHVSHVANLKDLLSKPISTDALAENFWPLDVDTVKLARTK